MRVANNLTAKLRMAAVIALGGLSLSACATRSYVDQQIAVVNDRINAVDAKATDAQQQAAAANAAAQAAAADARNANSRIDQLTTRVDTMQQTTVVRTPRG